MATCSTLGHVNLYYEIHGNGPPLVLLNGLGLDVAAWGPQIDALARRFRVVAWDARGAGRSSAPEPPYSARDLAQDAVALMDELRIDRAHLVGLSMGGLVAQEIAVAHPTRVDRVVLAATAARLPPRSRHVIDVWARMVRAGVDRETFLREQLAWVFTDGFLADERRVTEVVAMLAQAPAPPARGFAGQASACLRYDGRQQAARVTAPALVLAGRDDRLIPFAASEELVRLIPGAELHAIDGAGHAFATESADAFNAAVLGFLGRGTTGDRERP